jgi:hypothetical protein
MLRELHFPGVATRVVSVTDEIRPLIFQLICSASLHISAVILASLIPKPTMAL